MSSRIPTRLSATALLDENGATLPVHYTYFTATDLDGAVATSLNVDEFGVFRPNEGAWTGTSPDGTASASDCEGWSTSGGTGTAGQVNTSSADWLGTFGTSCGAGVHLYCFSNVAAVIFTDSLESAETTAWSWWVPAPP